MEIVKQVEVEAKVDVARKLAGPFFFPTLASTVTFLYEEQ